MTAPGSGDYRCGAVAFLGRPNAGKSTLLNALLGETVAITSPKAQTTRGRTLGVITRPEAQILLYDTPGVSRGQARFNRAMTEAALAVGRDADVRVLLLDAAGEWDAPEQTLSELPPPIILVRTKRDLRAPVPVPSTDRFAAVLEISARTGFGLDALLEQLVARLPASPALYPDDYLTDRPLRFLAAERIREVAFEQLREELPYALAVEVQQWKETDDEVRIRADLLVERESQKGMVVGAGGRMLKALGTEARQRIAQMIGKRVHLELWVKTDRNWSKRPARARELGYL